MFEKETNYLYTKPAFSHLAFALIATFLILVFYQSTLFLGTLIVYNNPDYSGFLAYVVGVNSLLFLLLPTLIASRISPLPFKELFRLKKPGLKLLFLSTAGIISFQIFVIGYSSLQESLVPESFKEYYKIFTDSIRNLYESILGGTTYLDYFKGILIGAMIPAISEEALFRGFFQRSLEEKLKPFWAILISGVVFGIIHMNPIDLIPLILIGLYLSSLAYFTGSIWIPIIVHFVNNFWALNIMYFFPLKELEEQSRQLPILFSSALTIFGIALTLIIFLSIIKLSQKEKNLLENEYRIL